MQAAIKKEVVTVGQQQRTHNRLGKPSAQDSPQVDVPTNTQAAAALDSESLSDPHEALRLIEHQSRRIGRMFNVFHWKFCLVWGLSWLVGYGVLGFATKATDGVTPWWAWCVAAALLVASVALSVVIGIRGVPGYKSSAQQARRYAKQGAIYGWTWFAAFFFGMGGLSMFVNRFALADEATTILYNMISILLVGVLYMIGGALWNDLSQLIIGVWMIVIAFVLPMLGVIAGFFVMAFLGGGAMLLLALWAVTLGSRNASFAPLMGRR
jgi:hypothetical protein